MAQDNDVVVISDLRSWHHPAKAVFTKYSVRLKKVELLHDRKCPVFYADFPWDPQTSPKSNAHRLSKFESDLLLANGKNDCAIQDDQDRIRIEIKWNSLSKKPEENIVSIRP